MQRFNHAEAKREGCKTSESGSNPTKGIATPATSSDSLRGVEYWDPVSDTYKSKRTNESVPDEIMQGKSALTGYETDSSVESDSASSIDSDVGEYWDPVTDSYKKQEDK